MGVAEVNLVATVYDMNSRSAALTDMSPLLSSSEVAALLGMSREQVWRLWSSGRLPGYRFDRHIRYSQADLEQFMASHYSAPSRSEAAQSRSQRPKVSSEYRRI